MGDALHLDGLQRLLWNFAAHRVITVAGRTGILNLLADRPADIVRRAALIGEGVDRIRQRSPETDAQMVALRKTIDQKLAI